MRNLEDKDKIRNNRFAEAIDYLKRNKVVTSQLELARLMGVDKNTISNIINYKTYVTEDILTKLQTAADCMFNLQWLRGTSDIMLATDIKHIVLPVNFEHVDKDSLDVSSVINAIIASKDETIAEKERRLAEKDALIAEKDKRLTEMEEQLGTLKAQLGIKTGASVKQKNELLDDYSFPIGVADEPGDADDRSL